MNQFQISRLSILIVTFSVILSFNNHAQKKKPFYGMLEYKITAADTSMNELFEPTTMVVYTNDTIVRLENETPTFGTQVTIRHLNFNKQYQLIESDFGKYAIQSDLSDYDTVAKKDRYTYSKSKSKKKILGKKCKSVTVSSEYYDKPKTFYYFKDYENKYVNTFPEIDGLLTEYYVVTFDLILKYELVRMSEYVPNIDLFGIPSDFQKISINDFMDKLFEFNSQMHQEGN